MSVRINARLEGEVARKLSYLRVRTGKSTTEVVRASIENYFEQVAGQRPAQFLLESFVGCASVEADLSERYKSQLGGLRAGKVSRGRGTTRQRRGAP